jgi:hypothetical protein
LTIYKSIGKEEEGKRCWEERRGEGGEEGGKKDKLINIILIIPP